MVGKHAIMKGIVQVECLGILLMALRLERRQSSYTRKDGCSEQGTALKKISALHMALNYVVGMKVIRYKLLKIASNTMH